jgi:hypothetical protein
VFQREFRPRPKGRGQEAILLTSVHEGCEQALAEGIATVKWDGSACAVIEQAPEKGPMPWVPLKLRSPLHLYRRYDAKQGKPAPAEGIPCDEPDAVTGHWPHWIPVTGGPEDRWLREAYLRLEQPLVVASYEFCGPHVQTNPQQLPEDRFVKHAEDVIPDLVRTFDGIRAHLEKARIEGIVFWFEGQPRAKIRRKDYGLHWPPKD